MAPPIVVAKRRGFGRWVYEPVTCPACEGEQVIHDVPLGPVHCQYCEDHPPYQDEYTVPCGLCRGEGELFIDGYASERELRLLGLARSPDPEDRRRFEQEVLGMTIELAEEESEPDPDWRW